MADTNTYQYLVATFEKYGWPSYKKMGFPGALYMAHLIHVVRYPTMGLDILNRLKAFSSNCEGLRKSKLLFLEDVRRSSMGYDPITKKSGKTLGGNYGPDRYFNIEDIAKVDSIRFTYNHVRLLEDGEPSDPLPKEYKPTPYPKNYFCLEKYQIE